MDRKQVIDREVQARLYNKGAEIGRVICCIWPVATYFLAPDVLNHWGTGSAILIASIAQFFWVPNAMGKWMSRDTN